MFIGSRLRQRVFGLPDPLTRQLDVRRDIKIPNAAGDLLADLWFPRGLTGTAPTMLVITPYGRAGLMSAIVGKTCAEHGFAVLVVSVRGTFGSGGEFEPMLHDVEDARAVLRWLRDEAPWFDGRIAGTGASYLGYTQWATAAAAKLEGVDLAAIVPHVTSSRLVLRFLPKNGFGLDGMFRWSIQVAWQEKSFPLLRVLARSRAVRAALDHLPLRDADLRVLGSHWPFFAATLDHDREDPYWANGDLWDSVVSVSPPASFVAGWFDIFLSDQLRDYQVARDAGVPVRLTIGPWVHSAPKGMATALRETVDWAGAYVDGAAPAERAPVRLFVMGVGQWRDFPSWPPPGCVDRRYFLLAAGWLGDAPQTAEPSTFTYDPNDPTPSVAGPLLLATKGSTDNRELEARRDVLTFDTPVLDRDVEVVGEIGARIWLRSTAPATDVFVRVCDVRPDGTSMNVCDELVNVSPDGITAVDVTLSATAHRFLRGHRIRVQVSSGAHPRFVRNAGTGEAFGSAVRLVPAHQEIFHDAEHPSSVTLPVLE
jgi:hypothetical protein